jgi:hypothetical protein
MGLLTSVLLAHAGPHNLVEWLIYGALLAVVLGVGVYVVRADGIDAPSAHGPESDVKPDAASRRRRRWP